MNSTDRRPNRPDRPTALPRRAPRGVARGLRAGASLAALVAAGPSWAGVVTFDPADGYAVGRSLDGQPGGSPRWRGAGGLATVVDLGDGGGAAQTSAADSPNFANLRFAPDAAFLGTADTRAAGKVPFGFELRSDAPPASEDFSGTFFLRIGEDADGDAKGTAVRLGVFDNGLVQLENQAGGGVTKVLDAAGKQVDLDDRAGEFVPIEGVIDFDAKTYTLTFDGVPQTFNGSPDLPFESAGQDEVGGASINAWNSDDAAARQVTIDDLRIGDDRVPAAAAAPAGGRAAEPERVALPEPTPFGGGDGLPGGGESVLPADALGAFFAGNYGPNKSLSTLDVVPVEGGPVNRAMRVSVGPDAGTPGSQAWHTEVKTRAIAPTQGRDVAHLRFYARTVESEAEQGTGEIDVYYQHAGRPYDPSFMYKATPGREWARYDVPFEVFRTYGAGEAELNFAVGMREQVVEIAGVQLVNYGQGSVAVADLPRTTQDYEGRSPDAAWRKAAHERIARLRTSPMTVRVVDAAGGPVAGATVRARMTRSAFDFGTAVNGDVWASDSSDSERFRRAVRENFNLASTENDLKIHNWYDEAKRAQTLRVLRDLKDAGLEVHGHVLVWPSWEKTRVPHAEVRAAAEAGDVGPLRELTNGYIEDATLGTAGLVDGWDVMNEPWNNNDFMKLMGEGEMAEWFRLARSYLPDAELFINDFGILNGEPFERNEHAREYHRVIQRLIDDGAPLDAIGFQGHFGNPIPPERVMDTIDHFRGFGKRMIVSEFDLRTADDGVYGDYLRDLLTVAYADEGFDGFILWGFWDGEHWLRNAPLFAENWTPKAGKATWDRLVLGEWQTDATATTGADGSAEVVGHRGEYAVSVTVDGRTVERAVTLGDATTVEVKLP